MERYKVSKFFYLDELVDCKTYHSYAKINRLDKLARKIDKELLTAIDDIREYMNEPGTINGWYRIYVRNNYELKRTLFDIDTYGIRQWSGLRVPASPYYSTNSMHSTFKAVDMIFSSRGWLKKAHQYINNNWKELNITGLEVDVSWLHIDTRFIYEQTKLFVFNRTSVLKNWTP